MRGGTVAARVPRSAARSPRDAAVAVLSRVESSAAYANVLLRHAVTAAQFSASDAGLTTELVLGTLRYQARVDWTLAGVLHYPMSELPDGIRAVLRIGVYQLLFLRIPPHAAVHESVDLAHRVGHAGTASLVNAALRRVAARGERPLPDGEADPVGRLAVEHAHPRWLVERWVQRWSAHEAAALCQANNTPAPAAVTVNTLKVTVDDLTRRLTAAGVRVSPTAVAEGLVVEGNFDERHGLVTAGLLSVQDPGAMLVTEALDPQPGEVIIDACAAPGGKTAHIAARMANSGRLIACDIHAAKTQTMAARAALLGIEILQVRSEDARNLGRVFPHHADRVLVDAPCSGLGVIRRRPEIKWRVRPEHLPALAARQGAILEGAAGAVRSGGVLVYSVCTTEPEEGEQVVARFQQDHPEFCREAIAWPQEFSAGPQPIGAATLLPHRHGTDGFFIARMKRTH